MVSTQHFYELGEIRQLNRFISLIQPLGDARLKTSSAHQLLILYRFSSTYVTSMWLSSSCHCFRGCRTLGKGLLMKYCKSKNPVPNFTPKTNFCIIHYVEIIKNNPKSKCGSVKNALVFLLKLEFIFIHFIYQWL